MKNVMYLLLLFSISLHASELKPFTTDGCSVFPDGDRENHTKWMTCCISHDFAYWKGGTQDERKLADDKLKQCVSDVGEKNISKIMHLGVRLGGEPFFPTWYRWGYGWPYPRGYKAITEEEKMQVKKNIAELIKLLNELVENEE